MNINIKNVEIEIGRKKLSLSLKQAKELRDVLLEAFPKQPYYRTYYPNYIFSDVTYSDNSGVAATGITQPINTFKPEASTITLAVN